MGDFEIKKSKVLEDFYTGGDFILSPSAKDLFTVCGAQVKVLDVTNGNEKYAVGEKDDPANVTCFTLLPSAVEIIIAYTNNIMKHYRLQESNATLIQQIRSTHTGPILFCKVSSDQSTLVTGSSDFSIKIWNLEEKLCHHTFHGKSLVSALTFVDSTTVVVGYFDGLVRAYNLSKQHVQPAEFTGHSSRISVIVPKDGNSDEVYVCSCDQTMSAIHVPTMKAIVTVPLFETVEGAIYIPLLSEVLTVGESGVLKYWDLKNRVAVTQQRLGSKALTGITYNESSNTIVCSTEENNLLFLDVNSRNVVRQLAGHNEEILDVCFVSHESNCIAVATNSPQLKIYEINTFSCAIVEGHTDNIMSVDSASWDSTLLATCSKDNNILFWRVKLLSEKSVPNIKKIAISTGHTNSVTAVKFSHQQAKPFVVSVSEDTTLKLWSLKPLMGKLEPTDPLTKLPASATFVAHTKSVTCVAISSNDKLCVTGSMDKTAKLWCIDCENMQLNVAGTLSGHRRGVWSAKFSNVSQTVATGSGDCTIKIFSLSDLSCLLTLEGHTFAVLCVEFIKDGTQILTADSNGILKAWDLKSGVCIKTSEVHEDKVWSIVTVQPSIETMNNLKKRKRKMLAEKTDLSELVLRTEEHVRYITVGSDGRIVFWEDVTDEYAAEKVRQEAKRLAQIQTLENFVRLEKYEEALKLSLTLDHPYQCYKLLELILEKENVLRSLLHGVNEKQLISLLNFVVQWNTNTRTYNVAQAVLLNLFNTINPKTLQRLEGFPDIVKALLPYTKRHFDRLTRTRQDVAFIGYALSRMRML